MRIIVLDGFAANPGDISWDKLKALGDVTVYDRTQESEILARAENAEAILTNKCPLRAKTIQKLPSLKYIGVLATGYNIVDTEEAKRRGIVVTNIPAYSTESVAQHVFALILEIAVHAGAHSAACLSGRWTNSRDFCFWDYPLTEICGKTLGIIGYGAIGKRVGTIAEAFGLRVIPYSPSMKKPENLDRIIEESDIISLNCPLKADNAGMISGKTIARMKTGVWIINTARGGLAVDSDVADALRSGKIGAYAADVATREPINGDNPLLSAPNVILTPHIAWAPFEARVRLMNIAVQNLRSFMDGNAIHQVNA